MNRVFIIGRLGRDPELKTATGNPMATLSVATDESYTDSAGARIDRTQWHRIVVFGRQAETCAQYLGKGRLILVEGKLQTRAWDDDQGRKHFITEIVAQRVQFLGPKDQSDAPGPRTPPPHKTAESSPNPLKDSPLFDEVTPWPDSAAEMDQVPF